MSTAFARRHLAGVLALLFLATSCGAMRFQRAWERHEAQPPSSGMEGRWKGEWRSEWNGHSGGLRCLMSAEGEGRYRAWFLSTYARIFSFQHETPLHVTGSAEGELRFEGQQDLGQAVGGVYRYVGSVRGDSFRATFQAENGDHGVFEMERVD